jgi:fibronectin-binding autotransporter adhesin
MARFFVRLLFAISALTILSISPLSSSAQSPVTGVGTWSEQTDYGASSGTSGSGGVPVQAESCVTNSGYIYCVGGFTGTTTGAGGSIGTSSQVFYAQLSSSGTIGAWTETTDYGAASGTSGNGGVAIEWPSCVTYNNYIYCVGGNGVSNVLSKVFYAPLSSSGVGAWTETTDYGASSGTSGTGGVDVFQVSCVQNAGYIYCIGDDGSKTFYAPLSSSGIGAWTETTDYGASSGTSGSGGVHVSAESCVADSSLSYVYCVGGVGSSFNFLSSAFFAPISSSGIGAWTETTDYGASSGTSGSGGVPIYGTECADVSGSNGLAVGIGGSGISDVFVSQIQPASSTYSSTIICVAGQTTDSVFTASVYYAALSSSGVGAWTQTTNYGDGPKPVYFEDLVTSPGAPTECVYTATADGNWNDPSIWSPSAPPNPIPRGCTVIIPPGITVTIPADLTIHNFGIIQNGGLITDSGTMFNSGSGTLINTGIVLIGGGSLINDGTLTNDGTLVTDNDGTITNQDGATITNELTIDNAGTISNAGTIANSGTINNAGTISGPGSITGNLIKPTTTASCSPASVAAGSSTTCTVTMSGVIGSVNGESVSFTSSSVTGSITPSASCTLNSMSCSVAYKDSIAGAPVVSASYPGDSNNGISSGSFILANFATAAISAASSETLLVGGSGSIDQTSQTGVSATISGSSGSSFTVLSADLGSQAPITLTFSLGNGHYFDVKVGGITDGMANVCFSSESVDSSTELYYYNVAWGELTSITRTTGNPGTICGEISVADLTGSYFAEGDPSNPSVPEFPFGIPAAIVAMSALYFVMRHRFGGMSKL